VHLTGGIWGIFGLFSTREQNPALEVLSTPAHPQVTRTTEKFVRLQLLLKKPQLVFETEVPYFLFFQIFEKNTGEHKTRVADWIIDADLLTLQGFKKEVEGYRRI